MMAPYTEQQRAPHGFGGRGGLRALVYSGTLIGRPYRLRCAFSIDDRRKWFRFWRPPA